LASGAGELNMNGAGYVNYDLIKQVLDLEETNPKEALRIYKKLESKNKEFHRDFIFFGIICPIIAYSVVFHLLQSPNPPRDLYTFLILAIVGFAPPSTMFIIKVKAKVGGIGGTEFIERLHTTTSGMIVGIAIVFSNLISLALLILLAIILATLLIIPISLVTLILPNTSFLWPSELPETVLWTSFISSFIVIFLIELAEPPLFNSGVFLSPPPPLTRRQMVKEFIEMIPVGLRLNFANKLKFIAGIFVSILLVGAGPLGLLYGDFYQGVAVFGFSGLLVGLSLSKAIEKDYYLGDLYQLGIIRCALRLDRRAEANYRIGRLSKERKLWRTSVVDNLNSGLSLYMDNHPNYRYFIGEAVKGAISANKYQSIYLANVQKTMSLADIEENTVLTKIFEGSYDGMGEVTEVLTYKEAPDYLPKQRVDIWVLSGEVGTTFRYGSGDVYRMTLMHDEENPPDLLEEGDLIGFYEEDGEKTWERIIFEQ
jgi:hypothetical protein